MSCENDCDRAPAFPREIFNRPALRRIAYRIGSYGDMRAHMLSLLDRSPALAAWTHRGSDDPGIALLEATAVVGDILALYQDDYANETLLRTATLPQSVTGLVRLLGYRPAPGLGGTARFALGVKGDTAVTVPAGLKLDAQLAGAPKPATFETTHALQAVPALSSFHLYRPRQVPDLRNGMQTFKLGAADGVVLKAGDRLMVGLPTGPAGNAAFDHTQVLEVDAVWDAFGIRCVRTKGRLENLGTGIGLRARGLGLGLAPVVSAVASAGTAASFTRAGSRVAGSALPAFSGVLAAGLAVTHVGSAAKLVAWKLGSSFRHFGHAAPATRVAVDGDGRATELPVVYERVLNASQGDPAGPRLQPRHLPLEGRVEGMVAGTEVLVEVNLAASSGGTVRKRLLSRRVQQVDGQSMAWGAQTGAATVLSLDAELAIVESGVALKHADIRGLAVHAVQGEAFELLAEPVNTSADCGSTLDFYGSAADALALVDRTVLLAEPAGAVATHVQRVQRRPSGEARHEVVLDREVDYRLYGHEDPRVDVFGNLVDATEGKSEAETVLGDGDGRASFQTFVLPKAPLTYRLDSMQSPPQRPELELRVDGLLWDRVESFFDCGPRDRGYIVRETDDGRSAVQFGDGVHGARLPSGQANVRASWRTGSGSRGALKAGASVSVQPRVAGFDKAWLLEPVTGGAAPEGPDSVRLAAPGSLQSLGRIVSLADYETEAQSLPGVLKARASWLLMDGAPVLCLTVLTDGLQHADRVALDTALRSAVEARGPARHALWLRLGNRRFVDLALRLGHDRRRRSADIAAAVRQVLGAGEDDRALDDPPTGGLFDWRERQFGQDVHGSQLFGRVQAVDGVAWVELLRLADRTPALARGLSVTATRTPVTSPMALPAVQQRLRCPADSLLALHVDQLALDWVPVDTTAPGIA